MTQTYEVRLAETGRGLFSGDYYPYEFLGQSLDHITIGSAELAWHNDCQHWLSSRDLSQDERVEFLSIIEAHNTTIERLWEEAEPKDHSK